MTWRGLLVSVRDACEAEEALAGGAAIVDAKEPGAGPLGAAAPETIAAIAAAAGDRDWTVACGELADGNGRRSGVDRVVSLVWRVSELAPAPPRLVKAGLSRLHGGAWRAALDDAVARVPAGVGFVAVAYADHARASAPGPEEVIDAAREAGCAGVLVDTFDKSGPGLFGAARPEEVAAWVARAHAAGLPIAVAGRLSLEEITSAAGTAADVVAVRSAVCAAGGRAGVSDGDRRGVVSRERVAAAVTRLAEAARRPR